MMDFGNMFLEILPPLELGRAVATLEVPLVRVNHHVVLELVLVPQLLSTNVTGVDRGVLMNHFHVVFEGLVRAVGFSALTLERFFTPVDIFMHQSVFVVEEPFAADGAVVLTNFPLVLVVTLDVRQQILLEQKFLVTDGASVLQLRRPPVGGLDRDR